MNLIPWKNKHDRTNGGGTVETSLSRFRNEIDGLFDRFLRNPWDIGSALTMGRGWGPRMDLAESDNEVTVKAELPGVDPKDIEINVSGNLLTLRGEKKHDREERGKDYHYLERQYGSFHRSIQLPTTVDSEKVTAEYKNGVLMVTMAKHPEAKPKKITVRNA